MADDAENKLRLPSEYKRRRAAGEIALGERHKRLAELMVLGLDAPADRLPSVEPGLPLSLEDAADVLGLKRRNARQIFGLPAFRKLLTSAIADLRMGAHARMVHTMIKIADDPGDGTAADRTVRLKAVLAVLGEEAKGANLTVNVGLQNNVAFKPGYVIRLPPDMAARPTLDARPVVTDNDPD